MQYLNEVDWPEAAVRLNLQEGSFRHTADSQIKFSRGSDPPVSDTQQLIDNKLSGKLPDNIDIN